MLINNYVTRCNDYVNVRTLILSRAAQGFYSTIMLMSSSYFVYGFCSRWFTRLICALINIIPKPRQHYLTMMIAVVMVMLM